MPQSFCSITWLTDRLGFAGIEPTSDSKGKQSRASFPECTLRRRRRSASVDFAQSDDAPSHRSRSGARTATTDFNSARRTSAATLRGPLSICRIRRGASEFERKLIFKEVIVAVIADEAAHPTTTRRDRSSRCRSIADRVGVSDDGSDILRKAPAVDGEAPASCNSRRRVERSGYTTTA